MMEVEVAHYFCITEGGSRPAKSPLPSADGLARRRRRLLMFVSVLNGGIYRSLEPPGGTRGRRGKKKGNLLGERGRDVVRSIPKIIQLLIAPVYVCTIYLLLFFNNIQHIPTRNEGTPFFLLSLLYFLDRFCWLLLSDTTSNTRRSDSLVQLWGIYEKDDKRIEEEEKKNGYFDPPPASWQ